jgi:hypothetical protein
MLIFGCIEFQIVWHVRQIGMNRYVLYQPVAIITVSSAIKRQSLLAYSYRHAPAWQVQQLIFPPQLHGVCFSDDQFFCHARSDASNIARVDPELIHALIPLT